MKRSIVGFLISLIFSTYGITQAKPEFQSTENKKLLETNRCMQLGDATETNDRESFYRILPQFENVNVVLECGLTALMNVSMMGHTEFAKELIQRGADVNASDKDGLTALMLATSFGKPQTVELLLGAGANPNARTKKHGLSALWYSLYSPYCQWDEYEDSAKLLRSYGAKEIKKSKLRKLKVGEEKYCL